MSNTIRLGHRLDHSEIYGPGVRSVFWTQGCTLACKGCWNTQYWSSRGGEEISVSQILNELDQLDGIEGITFILDFAIPLSSNRLSCFCQITKRASSIFPF